MRGKNLNCDAAVETRVACAVHFSHATRAERGEDFIRPEFGACRQGHTAGHYNRPEERHYSHGPATRYLEKSTDSALAVRVPRDNSRVVGFTGQSLPMLRVCEFCTLR